MRILLPLINRLLSKKIKTERESISYQEAKKVGVIYSNDDIKMADSLMELIQKLENDGKTINKLILDTSTEKLDNPFSFKKSDISFFGTWKNDNVKKFYDTNFDFLLYPSELTSPVIENILLHSKCKCRIGIYNDDFAHIFEMMVKMPSKATESQKMDTIYKYLKVLK